MTDFVADDSGNAAASRPSARPPGPLRLALVTRRYPPLIGGAEKLLRYLAEALAREGADVTVLTSRAPGTEHEPRHEERTWDGPHGLGRLSVVRLPTVPFRFVGTWLYMNHLRGWLESHSYDLAYVSMLKHDAYVAIGVGRRRGFPVVLRPEGAGATGDITWQNWANFGRRIAARCREADAFVAISRTIARELEEAGYDRTRIHQLPNGVPVPEAPWQPRPGWREAPRGVFVGRLAGEKGLSTLIESWALVRAAHPRATLTLVGDGPEREAILTQAQARGLDVGAGRAVELRGPMRDVEPVLRASDLFILPSLEEGMSIALLEAMALGIPLVATAIPGNRRLIGDYKHGRLVAPGDPVALARTIQEQWADFDRAFHMSRVARRRVENEFSIATVARAHLTLFEHLRQCKRGASERIRVV